MSLDSSFVWYSFLKVIYTFQGRADPGSSMVAIAAKEIVLLNLLEKIWLSMLAAVAVGILSAIAALAGAAIGAGGLAQAFSIWVLM